MRPKCVTDGVLMSMQNGIIGWGGSKFLLGFSGVMDAMVLIYMQGRASAVAHGVSKIDIFLPYPPLIKCIRWKGENHHSSTSLPLAPPPCVSE